MKKIFKYASVATGCVLAVYVLIMLMAEGFRLGLVPLSVFSAAFILHGVFLEKFKNTVSVFLVCVSLAVVVFAGSLAVYGNNDNVTYKEEVVIVLGKGLDGDKVPPDLANRLDKAVEYHQKNPDALIVVSGGKGPDEKISEALAMEKYLIDKGIPSDIIIKEDKSTSTQENFAFSSDIISEKIGDDYSAALITNNFHVYRAQKYAEMAGMNVTHLGADIQWYSVPSNYMREILVVAQYWAKTIV